MTIGARPGFPGTFNVAGSGIFIDTVTVSGAGRNGVFDVEGAGVCVDPVGGCGLLSFDAHLNTLSLVGSIPELGILAPLVLVTSSTFDQALNMTAIGNFRLDASIQASERDIKAAELLAALGLDPASSFWFELSVTGVRAPGPDSYLVTDTNLTNTSVTNIVVPEVINTVVPEPGSLLLLGTGLIGVVRALRRNHAARA